MNKKIIITGATGFIGKKLSKALIERGEQLTIFTQSLEKGKTEIPNAYDYVRWDYNNPGEWEKHLNGKDAVIHLAGANLFGRRWNKEYKKTIMESREIGTRNIVEAISKAEKKPPVFICSSAVGYYGDSGNSTLTEDSPNGNDFLASVCMRWESSAAEVEKLGVRRVSIRTGLILSIEEGALKKMLLPFKLFIGGSLGDGKQWFPWIHVDDIIGIYLYALDNVNLKGSVNAAAPNPVRMKEFARTLGKTLHKPSFFSVPEFVLRVVLGEFAYAVTASLKVTPQKLKDMNYKFKFERLEDALKDLLL
jgi:uncharacterized protein (TIGR01777 family)